MRPTRSQPTNETEISLQQNSLSLKRQNATLYFALTMADAFAR